MVIAPTCYTYNSTGKTKSASHIKSSYFTPQGWLRDGLFDLGRILPSVTTIEIYRHETLFRYHKHRTIKSTLIKHNYYYNKSSYRRKCIREACTTFRKLETIVIPLVRSSLGKSRVPRELGSHAIVSSTNSHSMYNNFITANR
jgi:hypothetical protein